MLSFLCHLRLRNTPGAIIGATEKTEWSDLLKRTLIDTITSFLSLNALSMLPLRIWTMKHMALSSALLLGFRTNLKREPTLIQPVQALIQAFSNTADDVDEESLNTLTVPHARALTILRELCSKNFSMGSSEISDRVNSELNNDQSFTEEVDLGGHKAGGENDQPLFGDSYESTMLWDDTFFSLLTGNANNVPSDILDFSVG